MAKAGAAHAVRGLGEIGGARHERVAGHAAMAGAALARAVRWRGHWVRIWVAVRGLRALGARGIGGLAGGVDVVVVHVIAVSVTVDKNPPEPGRVGAHVVVVVETF